MSQVVLITGAGRGIGAAAAKRFAAQGFHVCINFRQNHQAAIALSAQIQAMGGQCSLHQADVSDEHQVKVLFSQIDQQVGVVDILVNNAALMQPQSKLVDMSAARLQRAFQANVMSYFYCCREAVLRMSTQTGGKGGVIVNVSSAAARTGSPFEYIDYAATKGAIDSLTIGLAKEVAAEGIRVNAVRPGLIHTQMHADGGEPERIERLKTRIPMGRGGQAEEVANAIYWLASNEASFVTGSLLDVTGGL